MSLIKRDRGLLWPTDVWPDERIDRVFRDMFREFLSAGPMDRLSGGWLNAMHLEEYIEDGSCVIRAELPGLDVDKDVEISVADGMLHVQAHREERKEDERPSGYRSEFRYGSFARSVRLPAGVTESDVKATYKDGILEIRFPMPAEEKPATKVPVEHD